MVLIKPSPLLRLRRRIAGLRGRSPYQLSGNGFMDRHRCVFIHLPKTAGTTLVRTLFDTGYRHWTAEELRQYDPGRFERYFKFCFVRNPYSRLASAYFFLKEGGALWMDEDFFEATLAQYPSFEAVVLEWLDRETRNDWWHFVPQIDFMTTKDGHRPMDFIGRFEQLEEDFIVIAEELGIDARLPEKKIRSSGVADYRELYTAEMIAKVADVYAEDLEILGYDFEGPRG